MLKLWSSVPLKQVIAAMPDQRTGVPCYMVRVSISPDETSQFKELKLFQGMQRSVTIKTGERTMLSYLLRPLQQRIESALLEYLGTNSGQVNRPELFSLHHFSFLICSKVNSFV